MKLELLNRSYCLSLLFAGLLFIACGTSTGIATDTDSTEATIDIIDTEEEEELSNSLDYTGTYTGTLPCADCSGIRTEISLTDSSYIKRTVYLGERKPELYEASGGASWDNQNHILTLGGITPPNRYLVGENTLIQLDSKGKRIYGELAEKYILLKK